VVQGQKHEGDAPNAQQAAVPPRAAASRSSLLPASTLLLVSQHGQGTPQGSQQSIPRLSPLANSSQPLARIPPAACGKRPKQVPDEWLAAASFSFRWVYSSTVTFGFLES